ncbi:TetR/AcrR family transcriptional regulator [Rhodospirillaceae bacterium KN72]|uniref:TetR/AcrR family transcriptional regulator n=1 Tax=Pacificispira spongiicola TaxID=2729598 RepID=A0A7Y0E3R7_9PROT|nr:TetR/AcrR family transcriptional regulator [Pacificispira spongiicola]NMM45901.1 TetR/AcrR family transcriptional regulator [Pacificispira spongiicola]
MPTDTRRDAIMNAAMEILVERGYRDTTMLAVAKRAQASKETLYSWFGDKTGLFTAIIHRNAELVRASLEQSMESESPLDQGLTDFGVEFITMLLGDSAIAINRAAIAEVNKDPSLSRALSASGRDATLPILVAYLDRHAERGALRVDDTKIAARSFLGLLIADDQISRLLGRISAPDRGQAERTARMAVASFLKLYGAC